ncbi:sigma-70 family RNA polymerase sigma factor [Acinetobacter larvae]|uniref:RNA polymerase subunit sigma n=1 Tax=Acinetobacter larvae TaxID=1789224 RepID=A0A1B2M3G5_9GAMM|nr:sigma-70 family RNA polymerase sigma factor [Acinetobacter larvae]AOA59737.1 RNA polymerase subunit sigma [Acinetobacter larvae]
MANLVEHLYQDHHQWLYQWLTKKMPNQQFAEDIAQDTFVRLLKKKNPIDPREPRALLLTIAKGMVSNFYRHQKIESSYLEFMASLPEEYAPDPATQVMLLEAVIALDQRLNGLKPMVKQAFLLTQLQGISQAETAKQLNISIATVQRYIIQALHQCCFSDLL